LGFIQGSVPGDYHRSFGSVNLPCTAKSPDSRQAFAGERGKATAGNIEQILMLGRHQRADKVVRAGAVKLVDDLAAESPASANCPVGTVDISGDGAGDQTVGSPDVKVLEGRTQVWSALTGGQAKQQVVA